MRQHFRDLFITQKPLGGSPALRNSNIQTKPTLAITSARELLTSLIAASDTTEDAESVSKPFSQLEIEWSAELNQILMEALKGLLNPKLSARYKQIERDFNNHPDNPDRVIARQSS